jgi:hypothetical protein
VKIMEILKQCFDPETNKFSGKEMGMISAAGFDFKKDKKIMPLISTAKVSYQPSPKNHRNQQWR